MFCFLWKEGGINAFENLWSQPAVAAIFPSDRIEVPEMPGRSNLISLLTTHVPLSQKHESENKAVKGHSKH